MNINRCFSESGAFLVRVFFALRLCLIGVSLPVFSAAPCALGGPITSEKESSAAPMHGTTPTVLSNTTWDLTGNLGTNPITNWIGTIDLQDMVFKTQSTERMRIYSNGTIGITNGLAVYGSGLTLAPSNSSPGQTISMSDDATSALSVNDGTNSDSTFQLYSNGSLLINLAGPPGSSAPNWGVGFRVNVIDPHTGNVGGNLFNVTPLGNVGIGITNLATNPYKKLTVNGDVSLANYNGSGGNATNGLNGIEVLGHGWVPGRRGISTGDDPSGDLNFFINSNQTAAAFHFKNGTAPNFQNYATAASAPVLMTLDATGSMTIPSLAFGSTFTSGSYRALLVDASNGRLVSASNVMIGTSSASWNLGGNTASTGQSIGTRDPGTDLPIIAGGVEVMRVQSNGATGDLRINDHSLVYLRGNGNDPNHGVGYFDGTTGFVGTPVDGPVLFGYSGGALGTNQAGFRNVALAWNSDGKVFIGKQTPTANGSPYADALLSVSGKVVSKSFYVTINYWADFVFEKDYKLMPLDDVETYYSANKHLPGVPSSNEMIQNGNNVAQTDAVLLQKIEELTLYTVELNKRVRALERKLGKHHNR